MKLQPDKSSAPTIRSYGPDWFEVQSGTAIQRFDTSVVMDARGEARTWDCRRYEDLDAAAFAALLAPPAGSPPNATRPELVLFGSGLKLRFPRPEWLQALVQAGIGLETMDTAAACRTYNVLASEGRHVVAALLLEN